MNVGADAVRNHAHPAPQAPQATAFAPQVAAPHRAAPWFDRRLLTVLALLIGYGLVMVYSASTGTGRSTGLATLEPLWRHLATLGAGLACGVLAAVLPCSVWRKAGLPLLVFGLLLLALVLAPGIGVELNGSRRWLYTGFVHVQPSEFMKLFVVIYAAAFIAGHRNGLHDFRSGVLPLVVVLALSSALLLAEPDLGAALVIVGTVLTMLLLGGMRFRHFLPGVLLLTAGAVLLVVLEPYRMARVLAFLDPWEHQFGSGFQLVQALIAFGRGEWLGVGLGAGIQKLFYLPHASSDFLLAVIGEELGLAGTLAVIALFGALAWYGFGAAARARNRELYFEAFLLQGMCLLLVLQALVNIGVNLGVLPTKGLTLPFMSRGGSSIVVCCIAGGIMLSAERAVRRLSRRRA